MKRIAVLIAGAIAAGNAWGVDQPSTYPGCAERAVSVAWGGSVDVDLSACQSFGLGELSRPPAHGDAQASGSPALGYVYVHGGQAPAGGGSDQFVVLDDNSDTITVRVSIGAPAGGLALIAPALTAPRAGKALRGRAAVSAGRAPLRFALVEGALPAGLALSGDGVISGTPSARGPFRATLAVTDADGQVARASVAGEVMPPEVSLIPGRAVVTAGQPFRLPLHARGGVPPYRFALEPGDLPPTGLVLDEAGVLQGTTAVPAGDYPVTIRITDASAGPGEHFTLARLRLVVRPAPGA